MGPLADSIKDSFPLGSQGCWSPNFTVKFKEQRSRSLREQGGLRYKKQERERERQKEAPTEGTRFHSTWFNSEETKARNEKVTYRVMQVVHG